MPLAPTGLSPWGGQSIPAASDNIFTWQSDGTQAAYYIEHVRNIVGAEVQNTGWQTMSTSEHTFAAGTFTVTYDYKWRVKIRNVAGIESAYSDWAVFRAGNPAVLTITYPANDLDQITSIPTYQHSYTHPDGYLQTAYQYGVYIGTTWDDFDALTAAEQESYTWDELELLELGEAIWDSGRVESSATSVEMPNGYFVSFEYWYKVRVTVWDSGGNEVTSDLRTFQLIIDDIPEVPFISATADPDNGQIIISITNPTPDPGQVETAYNRIYRKQPDGTWLLIADNIISSQGYDRTCKSNKNEEYAATAVGTNDIESSRSPSVIQKCILNAFWFTDPAANEAINLALDAKWGQMQSEREREEYWGVDEKYPVVQYGSMRCYRGAFSALTKKLETTWPAYIEQLRGVLDADSKGPLVFRTPYGDVFNVDVYDFQVEQATRDDVLRQVSFNLVEVEAATPAGSYYYDTPTDDGFWVIDPDTNLGFGLYIDPEWGGMKSERDRAEQFGFNVEMPAVNYGSKKAYRGGFSGCLAVTPGSDLILPEILMRFRALVDGKIKKPLLFQTFSGDQFLVDIYGFSFELADHQDNLRQVSFEFVEVGEPPQEDAETYFIGPGFPAEF